MAFETFGIIPRALKRIFNEFQNVKSLIVIFNTM